MFKIRVTSSLGGVVNETLTPHAETAGVRGKVASVEALTKGDRRTAGKAGCHAIGQIRNDGSIIKCFGNDHANTDGAPYGGH